MCSLILLLLVLFGLFPTFSQAQNNPGGISGPGWFVGEGSPVSPDQADAYFAAQRAELLCRFSKTGRQNRRICRHSI